MYRVTVFTKFEDNDPIFTADTEENLHKMLDIITTAGYECSVYKVKK